VEREVKEEHTMTGPEIRSSVTDEDAEAYCRGYNDALTDPDPIEREEGELAFNYPELWAEYLKVSDAGNAPDDDRWEEPNAKLTGLAEDLWRSRNANIAST
jgi:hypothetical protein